MWFCRPMLSSKLQTPPRKIHSMPSNFTVIEPNYSLNIVLWNATLLLHQAMQIPSKLERYLWLFTNHTWHTGSGRPKREFCSDPFRLTIRELRTWRLRNNWWRHYPLRAPIRNHIHNRRVSTQPLYCGYRGHIYPYTSGLIHWHWGNHTIAPVPVKQPWRI